jgi:hypothetical protein
MAGTITVSTISDGTNSTSSTNCIRGSALAWVNFNGTAGTVTAAYNVTSITKNGTGDYNVNFTNAFSDTKYAVLKAVSEGGNYYVSRANNAAKTTSLINLQVNNSAGSNADASEIGVACFR